MGHAGWDGTLAACQSGGGVGGESRAAAQPGGGAAGLVLAWTAGGVAGEFLRHAWVIDGMRERPLLRPLPRARGLSSLRAILAHPFAHPLATRIVR